MEPGESGPRCANQVHAHMGGGKPEPTQVCSCAAGLIHMLDCPVDLGLPCAFFRALEGEPAALDATAADEVHSRLMHDYLSRAYYHRIRSLAPAGNPWLRRREELYAFYSTVELEGREPVEDEEGYERERERLCGLRREREEARKERDQMTREEKARERARLGIKTVVERAQEAVALRSTPAESGPEPEAEAGLPRRSPAEAEAGGPGGEEPAEGPADGDADGPAESPAGGPAEGPPGGPADGRPEGSPEGPPRRRRRRRRRRRSGGGPPAPPA